METIELNLEEISELSFKLRIEGQSAGSVTARLYCESEKGVSHVFSGKFDGDPDTVTFRLSNMNKLMSEGSYPAWVEVLVENKQFVPTRFNLSFKKPVSVQMESHVIREHKKAPAVSVSSVIVKKSAELVAVAHPTLREKLEKKNATGLDEETMKTVAKSVMERLIAKDFDGKGRK